jgi:tetratricopeptide (TPR) repeat protein
MMSITVYSQTQQPYSRSEVDLKLELQQAAIDKKLHEAQVIKDSVDEKFNHHDKQVAQLQSSFSNQITILNIFLVIAGIGVPFLILIVSWRLNKRLNRSLKEVEKELDTLKDRTKDEMRMIKDMARMEVSAAKQEVELARKDIEKMLLEAKQARAQVDNEMKEINTLKCKVEELTKQTELLKSRATTSVDHIETLEERVKKLAQTVSKEDIETTSKIKEEVEETVKEITETKKEEDYTAEEWFLKGYDAINNKDYEKACEYFEKAIKIKVDYAEAYNDWGTSLTRLYQENEDVSLLKKGIDKYQKAIKIKPDYALAYYNWGGALSYLAERENSIHLYEEAIRKYKKATELREDYADAFFNWGYALFEIAKEGNQLKENIQKIAEKFIKAEELGDNDAAYNLACLYSSLNEKDEAFEWMETALMRNEKYTRDFFETDRDFANIVNDERFNKLLDEYRPIEKVLVDNDEESDAEEEANIIDDESETKIVDEDKENE